jgi:hypothetical protein
MPATADSAGGVTSRGYRWYAAAQVVSIVGTMMGYTALYWLALRIGHGGAAVLSAVERPSPCPCCCSAAGSLAIGIPLLTGWMSSWYLIPLSFAIGCVQTVDVPARQTFMLDLVGRVFAGCLTCRRMSGRLPRWRCCSVASVFR